MKTKEEILKKYLNDVMFRHYPSSIKLIEGAMEEYAEQQVKNCTITDVIKSVCDCGIPQPDADRECCTICDKLIYEDD